MPKRNAGDDLVDRGPGTTCVSKCFPFSRLRHRGEMSALLTNRPSPARNWKLKSGSQPDNRPSRASSVKKPTLSLPTLSPGSPLAPLTLYCQRKRSFKSSVASQDWGGSLCQKQCNLKLELSTDLDVFFRCTMCPAFIQPDLSAACETPVLHGSQNLLEKSTQEIFLFSSFTLHVSILFLLGFGWDGHLF